MPVWIIFILFLTILFGLHLTITEINVSRKAAPSSLYPSVFFDEVFSICSKNDKAKIENLQKEIEALQPIRTTSCNSSISESVKHITEMYQKILQNYLANVQDNTKRSCTIKQLERKIELEHSIIKEEKDSFVSDNGESTISFILNRQNYLTDTLLTGITIPMLLEALQWDVKGIGEFMTTMSEKPIMQLVVNVFVIVFLYRILKYYKNKRSMLRCMAQTVLYNKAEILLCAFECALKNISSNHQNS